MRGGYCDRRGVSEGPTLAVLVGCVPTTRDEARDEEHICLWRQLRWSGLQSPIHPATVGLVRPSLGHEHQRHCLASSNAGHIGMWCHRIRGVTRTVPVLRRRGVGGGCGASNMASLQRPAATWDLQGQVGHSADATLVLEKVCRLTILPNVHCCNPEIKSSC